MGVGMGTGMRGGDDKVGFAGCGLRSVGQDCGCVEVQGPDWGIEGGGGVDGWGAGGWKVETERGVERMRGWDRERGVGA